MRRSVRGFTLLELLIATTLMATVVLLGAMALRITLKTLHSGSVALTQHEKKCFVLYKITSQVISIRPYKLKEEKQPVLFFYGGEESMEFISPSPLSSPGVPGLYRVKLLLKGDSIYEQEARILDDSHLKEEIRGDEIEVLKGIKNPTLSYFDDREKKWSNTWRENYLPRAVKIQGRVKERSWSIIIPILAGNKWSLQGEAS